MNNKGGGNILGLNIIHVQYVINVSCNSKKNEKIIKSKIK